MDSGFIILFPIITVALISIIIGRKIRSEQKIIGTLSALGYKKSTLMLHYSLLAVIPGFIGGLLMTATAAGLAQWFGGLGLADYEPMQPEFNLPVPTIGIVTACYFISLLMVRRKIEKVDMVESLKDHRE